ncbi:MAG: hypothetical protein EU530_04260, partial [Promethearchaeota archaeon]
MNDLREYPFWEVSLSDPFWDELTKVNLDALYYQWEQLEKTRCIDNFRIAAGTRQGFREGWFFSDSDAYKWLDAAARYHKIHPHKELLYLMDIFIQLIKKVQMDNGYLYTYNQIFFPNQKWMNLFIEHELYCLGHLIEAIISVYQTFQDRSVLYIATKAADLIVQDFMDKDGTYVPGHQEIEIALLKLYETTQNENYLKMSEQFLTRRGDVKGIFFKYLNQNKSVGKRSSYVKKMKEKFFAEHPEYEPFKLPAHVKPNNPAFIILRWMANTGSGKGHQQHDLLKNQLTPEGHSVRFTYTQAAIAHLHRHHTHPELFNASKQCWEHMVDKRTYPTGGLGSLPLIEGWGRDYELDGEFAYCETCAAIGSLLWNWQLTVITKEAKYADFFEWQLYNAVLTGLGVKGDTYLYRNPLISKGTIKRENWYQVPCCPSNLSRTIAEMGGKIISSENDAIYLHQYIGSRVNTPKANIQIESSFPWNGNIKISIDPKSSFNLNLRIPSWCTNPAVNLNNEPVDLPLKQKTMEPTASGYSPHESNYLTAEHEWKSGDRIDINFPMEINVLRYHKKVKNYKNRGTLTRGP